MLHSIYKVIIISTLLFFSITASKAQCDESVIIEASDYYLVGNFENALSELKNCDSSLTFNFEDTELQLRALIVLAKIFIAQDSLDHAATIVGRIVKANPNYETRIEDPAFFQELIKRHRRLLQNTQVASVSKIEENIYESPATVIQITSEQIKRRGYMDLEQLLHDLPGFDISRSNGVLYSNIYQRGYRSDNTNRMLLMIDGVEENDLWASVVYLSRQYPITNIKNVEVIYGPTSTVYGSNAFLGVIYITTKNATEIVDEGKRVGIIAEAGYGDWNTRYGDVTIAATSEDNEISFSFTGRAFLSDEASHGFGEVSLESPFPYIEKDETYEDLFKFYTSLDYYTLPTGGEFYQKNKDHKNSDYFEMTMDEYGDTIIQLSRVGLNRIIDIENEYLKGKEYSDETKTYFALAKFKIGKIRLGWQYWQKEEGTGTWFSEINRVGTKGGAKWSPFNNSLYARYDNQFNKKFKFTNFTRFKTHGYLSSNQSVDVYSYSNGDYSLEDLLEDRTIELENVRLSTRSNQLRSENRFLFTPTNNLNILSGVEIRYTTAQDNYSEEAFDGESQANDHYFLGEVGAYTQIRYEKEKLFFDDDKLIFTGGLRMDYNFIFDTTGYVTNVDSSILEYIGETNEHKAFQWSPRIALVYSKSKYIFKAVYATAFKNPTTFDRFSTGGGLRDFPNPYLKPEKGTNLELSARRFLNDGKKSSIEIVGYLANYTDAIMTTYAFTNTSIVAFFDNSGQREIYGVQLWADYRFNTEWGKFYLYGNYTFTNPTQYEYDEFFDEYDTLRIGDIASHQINFGGNILIRNRLNINLRGNFVGQRLTGYDYDEDSPQTTVFYNFSTFEPYLVLYGAISYSFPKQGITIQGVINNLTNKQYNSPGVRVADNLPNSSELPQNPINVHLKVKWDFSM